MPYSEGLSPSKFWHETNTDGFRRYFEFLQSCLAHDSPLNSIANGIISLTEKLFEKLPIAKPYDDGCNRILKRAKQELNRSDEPTFLFVNIMDAHGPLTNVRGYDQSLLSKQSRSRTPQLDALHMNMDETIDDHSDEIEIYRELYAAAVEYTSRQVAEFSESLSDETAVIVTADHGEQLAEGEQDRHFGHVTPDMTEPLQHVPLEIINTTVDVDESEFISHLDLGRLVRAIANDRPFEKERLPAAEVAGLGVAHPPTDHEQFEYWNRSSRSVYLGDIKYVWDSLGTARRWQHHNGKLSLIHENDIREIPSEAKCMFSVDITDFISNTATEDLTDELESQLKELGYL